MHNIQVPIVSVLMSVYNGEPYISDAIESILSQTFKAFEFIIIDDGSTDRSCDIIEKYKANDPRIILVKQTNQGLVSSLNKGLGIARSPLIARMDADDIALEERLEKQVLFINSHPDVLALGTAIRLIDQANKPIKDIVFPTRSEQLLPLMKKSNQMAHPSVLFSRDAVIEIGGYREILQYAEDYDLWLRLSEIGRIENLSEVLLLYRDHTSNISKTHNLKQWMATLCAKYASIKRENGSPDQLDKIKPPLTIEKMHSLSMIPADELENFCKQIMKILYRRRTHLSVDEKYMLDFILKYIRSNISLFFNLKVLRNFLVLSCLNKNLHKRNDSHF